MQQEHILKADLLDIIFENRNKQYGAYALRKYYQSRLYRALALCFLLTLILCVFIFMYKAPRVSKVEYVETKWASIPVVEIRKKETTATPRPPAVPKQPAAPAAMRAEQFLSNIAIVKDPAMATRLAVNLDSSVISSITSVAPTGINKVRAADSIHGDGQPEKRNQVDRNTVLATAEIPPSFPGGEEALLRFLERNLSNPTEVAQDESISVRIRFVVGYDGMLKGFETIQDGGTAFNNEVVRVLKKMPRWIPGKTSGENVSVYYSIPVKFISQP